MCRFPFPIPFDCCRTPDTECFTVLVMNGVYRWTIQSVGSLTHSNRPASTGHELTYSVLRTVTSAVPPIHLDSAPTGCSTCWGRTTWLQILVSQLNRNPLKANSSNRVSWLLFVKYGLRCRTVKLSIILYSYSHSSISMRRCRRKRHSLMYSLVSFIMRKCISEGKGNQPFSS